MDDINNILSSGEELDEQLMNYLEGNLSGDEQQKIEQQIAGDEFVKEAIEGLQQFSSNTKLDQYVRNLNQNLQQQLAIKKKNKWKRSLSHPSWIVMATILILVLCVLAYFVIMFVKNHS